MARSALGTWRAVKIVYRARFKDDRPYEREFGGILKYEPVSRTHEGLVQVLHAGRNDEAGCFYYVMELADPDDATASAHTPATESQSRPQPCVFSPANYQPRTLRSELARHQRLPLAAAAQLTLGLAKALRHLHERGLVHRDIKPSNVIFVAGQPKLADIGLVTDVGSAQSFVGTEGFIPPEGPGTPRADLYALGKLLYELATGRDRMDFPQLPPHLLQLPEGEALLELNEVVTRACAPNPEHRYSTATEVQAELNLFLAGRSLRRTRVIERGLARLKKVAIVACVLLVLTAGALWFSKREERHARAMALVASERARSESVLRERAEAAEHQSQRQLYTALLEQARATVRSADFGQRVRTLNAIRRAAAISNTVELRREVLAALALPDWRLERELAAGTNFTLRWLDPKFERIALCRGRGPIEIRAVAEDRLLATLPASTNLMCYGAMWSPDGRFLTVKRDYDTSGARCDLEIWNVTEPRQVLLIREARWNARSYHPDKPQLLTGGGGGLLAAWDLEQGKELWRTNVEATLQNLVYAPDGHRVAVSYRHTNGWGVSVHNVTDRAMLASQILTNLISSLCWHPAGRWLAVTDMSGNVNVMDSQTGELRLLGRHKAEATTSVFSPDGDYLVTGGWERELICWDMQTMQRVMTIALDGYIAQFRDDGRACALLKQNNVELFSFQYPSAHRRFAEDLGPRLRHAAFSPDGRWLAASADQRVAVWDLQQGGPAALTDGGAETQLFWTQDGRELFGSSRKEECYRWRILPAANSRSPPVLQRLQLARPAGFWSLSLLSDRILWTAERGSRITGLDNLATEGGRWADTIQGIVGISPDERWVGISRAYGTVAYVYRLPEMVPVARLTNQASIAGFSFSPSQNELGVVSRGQIEFWNTTTWERIRTATDFIGLPDIGLLFQPDGRAAWLAKDFRTAGLYDARTLEPILSLPTGTFPLALSANGRQLAVSVDAQRLQVWDLDAVRAQLRELALDWMER